MHFKQAFGYAFNKSYTNTPIYGYTISSKGVTNSVGMTKIKMVVTSFYDLAFLGEPVGRAYPPPKNQGKLVQCS